MGRKGPVKSVKPRSYKVASPHLREGHQSAKFLF